ncbi:hypothetical protein [uncultured Psychrobacter sp.]|uniref:hypothetical protein n=1 Tax=uncultured Psychrobacter sp. TaxID=259303 RepID=UPI00262C9D85|nr:hypothetical protein [uncultured Psychrobacter sp.]
MNNITTDSVFGINRDLPLNYVSRKNIDSALLNNLLRKKHLIIYGSSKQGKTSLIKKCIEKEEYITIHCSNKWSLEKLHEAILKKTGYEVTLSENKTTSGKSKILAKFTANFFGNKAEGGAEAERSHADSITISPLELDSSDVNDIIQALNSINFEKHIVLEDFHYLPVDTQIDFAVALKAFHEQSSLSFIIVGVWLEENRLSVYNGDLTGRVLPIDADQWKQCELREVISKGENILNIKFTDEFKNHLIDACYESVYIVQESCNRCCYLNNIFESQEENKIIGDKNQCVEIISYVVSQQSGRFNSFLTQFASGFQDAELKMHKWLLYPILVSNDEKLEIGFTQAEIRNIISTKHPRGSSLNPGNITQALQSITSLQIKKGIKPIVLDYDQTNLRLNIVDKSFLIWLTKQNRRELLELVDLPSEV